MGRRHGNEDASAPNAHQPGSPGEANGDEAPVVRRKNDTGSRRRVTVRKPRSNEVADEPVLPPSVITTIQCPRCLCQIDGVNNNYYCPRCEWVNQYGSLTSAQDTND